MIDGKTDFNPLQNFFINDQDNNWYGKLGKYILRKVKQMDQTQVHQSLQMHATRDAETFILNRQRNYQSMGMMFTTSTLDKDAMEKIFKAEATYHDEFGEGMKGVEVKRKHSKSQFASYFVKINGLNFHIGFDNRGTSIEVQLPFSNDSDLTRCKELYDAMILLVDAYFQTQP